MADPDARLTNLLGAVALAASDGLAPERGPSAAGALVHLLAHPGSSVERLRGVLGISQPATVRVVDRLQADGLLERRPGPDRRTLALVLGPAGEREARRVLGARRAALAPLLAPLGEEDRRTLERLLDAMVERLAEDRPGAEHACRLCDRGACSAGAPCPLEHTTAAAG